MRRLIPAKTLKSELQRRIESDPLFHGMAIKNKSKAVLIREMNGRIRDQYRTAVTARNVKVVLLFVIPLAIIYIAFQPPQSSLNQDVRILENKVFVKNEIIQRLEGQLRNNELMMNNTRAECKEYKDAMDDVNEELHAKQTEHAMLRKHLRSEVNEWVRTNNFTNIVSTFNEIQRKLDEIENTKEWSPGAYAGLEKMELIQYIVGLSWAPIIWVVISGVSVVALFAIFLVFYCVCIK